MSALYSDRLDGQRLAFDSLPTTMPDGPDRPLELALAGAGLGVWEWRRKTGQLILSAKAREICGFPARGRVTTRMAAAIIRRGDRPRVCERIRKALEARVGEDTFQFRIVTPTGERRLVALNGKAVFERPDGARATRFVGVLRDITAERAAQVEQEGSATRLRLALEAAHAAVWQADLVSGLVNGPGVNELLGYPSDRMLTADDVRSHFLPGELERLRSVIYADLARGEPTEVEVRIRRLDGKARWLLERGELAPHIEGQPRAIVGIAMDITDRREAEERMKLLAREVDHRAHNLLAVVQGVVQLSTASTPQALKRVLLGRISALGRAHQLLSSARWQGADLRRLVKEELLAFTLGETARFCIRGEDVALPPAAAQAVAMALHELATNASKYGALSAPTGRVDVSWTRQDSGPLAIRWRESGGPPVTPPTRRGLGAAMLDRALDGLKGETSLVWRPEGLLCEMTLPGEAMEIGSTSEP